MSSTWLGDRLAVEDVICKIGVYADNHEIARLEGLFASGATVDYQSSGQRYDHVPAADYLAAVAQFLPGFDASTHHTTNFEISVRGAVAHARSVVTAYHRVGEHIWTVGGIYRHVLVKDAQGWRISHMSFRLGWGCGNEAVVELARENARRLSIVAYPER